MASTSNGDKVTTWSSGVALVVAVALVVVVVVVVEDAGAVWAWINAQGAKYGDQHGN